MNWLTLVFIGGVITAFLVLKRLAFIAPAKARALLEQGGLIIDVRTRGEFKERHLPGAINLPLDELPKGIAGVAPDKEKALLLHCLSGGRSGIGQGILKKLGYRNVFNLGSYGRAERILAAQAKTRHQG